MFIMWNPGWRREVTDDDIGPDGADTGGMGNGCVNSKGVGEVRGGSKRDRRIEGRFGDEIE